MMLHTKGLRKILRYVISRGCCVCNEDKLKVVIDISHYKLIAGLDVIYNTELISKASNESET